MSFKYRLIKALDICGLTFLTPVVRLCYGEEPRKQWQEIGRYIVVPVLAFALFVAAWGYLAPRHTTKYGAVPTPGEVWSAWKSILTFHQRETTKEELVVADEHRRQQMLEFADKRLAELTPLLAEASAAVAKARVAETARKDASALLLEQEAEQLRTNYTTQRVQKQNDLKALAEDLSTAADRSTLLARQREFNAWDEEQKSLQSELKARIAALRSKKDTDLAAAIALESKYAEEAEYLRKLQELAGVGSRSAAIARAEAKLAEHEQKYQSATGPAALMLAQQQTTQRDRLEADRNKTYAKPWTLPMQVVRSVCCVFVGFLIGVALAIPLGVMCGLNKTFMAAMTPFIALFKPVSPIVWLLILWIIVGGFFPDPNNSPFLDSVNYLVNGVLYCIPFVGSVVGDLQINPAFIAAALTVSMCSLWATLTNTALGVASVDKDHYNVARVLRLGFWSRLFKIVLPSALPLVFAGMRISLGVGWMVLIAAELLASSEGLGKFTNDMFQNGDSRSFAYIMVMVFVVGIIGLVLDRLMIILQRLFSFDGAAATV